MAVTTENAKFVQGVHKIAQTDIAPAKTGWGAWTGTPTRTTIATGSATTANNAEAIKALIDDLLALGILSP